VDQEKYSRPFPLGKAEDVERLTEKGVYAGHPAAMLLKESLINVRGNVVSG